YSAYWYRTSQPVPPWFIRHRICPVPAPHAKPDATPGGTHQITAAQVRRCSWSCMRGQRLAHPGDSRVVVPRIRTASADLGLAPGPALGKPTGYSVTAPPQVWFSKVARAWILSGPGRLAM